MQTRVKLILVVVVVVAIAGAGLLTLILSSAGARPSTDSPSSAKLNIDIICESERSFYTEFGSAATAEVFVRECKEGKYPEVIEKWKQDNAFPDDRAI